MGFLDRALAVVGLRRAQGGRRRRLGQMPSQLRTFAAAQFSRLNADLFSGTTSGAQDIRVDLRVLRNRSRTAFRDSSVAKRYGNLFAESVIGENGILFQPMALGANGEFDKELNARHKAAFDDWAANHCMVDGVMDWVDLLQARRRLEPMDGEVIVRMIDGAENPYGFALKLYDADQLDLDYNVEAVGGKNLVRQGVELDRFGKPVAYHLWEGHPGDTNRGRRERVPAADILHDFIAWRPGAMRGLPWLHACLGNLNMLEGYLEAELVAARQGAAKMGWLAFNDDDEEGPIDVPDEVQPGMWGRVPEGTELLEYDPTHPNAVMPDFLKANVRLVAIAGNVSYHSLSGDLEAVNYSSLRAGAIAERDFFRLLQQREIRRFCKRVHKRWLRMAGLTGAFPHRASDTPRLLTNRWLPRGYAWADPLADIQTAEREVKLGINSRTKLAAERGHDLRELLPEIDAEQQLAAEYEVPIQGTDRPAVMPNEEKSETDTTKTAKEAGTNEDRRLTRIA